MLGAQPAFVLRLLLCWEKLALLVYHFSCVGVFCVVDNISSLIAFYAQGLSSPQQQVEAKIVNLIFAYLPRQLPQLIVLDSHPLC